MRLIGKLTFLIAVALYFTGCTDSNGVNNNGTPKFDQYSYSNDKYALDVNFEAYGDAYTAVLHSHECSQKGFINSSVNDQSSGLIVTLNEPDGCKEFNDNSFKYTLDGAALILCLEDACELLY